MEYDYYFDSQGRPQAQFSMDHELFGQWLSDEVGNDQSICQSLIKQIEILESGNTGELTIQGKELTLTLTSYEVTICNDPYGFDDDDELSEHGLEAMENHAGSGLPDFKAVVLDWKTFITN